MIRTFFRDTGMLTVVNLLTQATALITFPIYSRYLGVEDYGLHDYLVLIGVLCGVVVTMEGHQAIIRLLNERETDEARRSLASSVLCFGMLVGGVIAAAVITFAFVREGHVLGVVCSPVLLSVAVVSWYLFLIKQQVIAVHRALLSTRAIALSAFAAFVVQLGVGISTIVFFEQGLLGLFCATASGSLVQILLLWWDKRSLFGCLIRRQDLQEAFAFSGPLVLSALGTIGWVYTDRYIAKAYLGLHEVGLLGVAYRFASVVSIFTGAMGMALSPLIYANHEKERTETARDVGLLFQGFVALGAFVVIGFAGYSRLVLGWLAPEAYLPAASLFALVASALLLGAASQFFPGLLLAKKTGQYAAIQLVGLGLNVLLSVWLAQRYGVIGVCIASVVTGLCALTAIGWAGQRTFPVRVVWWRIVGCLVVSGVCVGLFYTERTGALYYVGLAAPWFFAVTVWFIHSLTSGGQGAMRT